MPQATGTQKLRCFNMFISRIRLAAAQDSLFFAPVKTVVRPYYGELLKAEITQSYLFLVIKCGRVLHALTEKAKLRVVQFSLTVVFNTAAT